MLTKTYPVTAVKAASEDSGIVEAIVSVFGNVDLVGDRVMPGAFKKSLGEWDARNAKGRYLPFTDSHDWTRAGRIGKVINAKEMDEGLWVKAQLFMVQESARDVFNQIKEGVVGEFSFAYDPHPVERTASDGANELIEVELLDVAAALHGANSETHLVGVKAGRTISAKTEGEIRQARDILDGILAQDQQAEPQKAIAEEPERAKAEPEVDAPVETAGEARAHVDLFAAEIEALSAL